MLLQNSENKNASTEIAFRFVTQIKMGEGKIKHKIRTCIKLNQCAAYYALLLTTNSMPKLRL